MVSGLPAAFTVCIGAWLSPTLPMPIECLFSQWVRMPESNSPPMDTEIRDRLYPTARSITVRVIVGRSGGSGVLFRQQGTLYTVVTNRHVVTGSAPYQIQTPEGRVYPASLLKKVDFRGNDLAMLQFRSRVAYAIAPLGHTTDLLPGTPVIAAGFPIDPVPAAKQGFLLTVGTISLVPTKVFGGGYRIGYTNSVYQGMSGGPLLNQQGSVIGLNSLHSYPLWGDPYIFQDGSKPEQAVRSLIIRSSWAIPIETILCIAAANPATRFANQPDPCPKNRGKDKGFRNTQRS